MSEAISFIPRISNGRWFRALPDGLRDALGEFAVVRRLPAGQCLFSRGDAPCGLYCVVEGAVRIGVVGANGKEALLGLIEPPNWFGEICLFDGQARTHDAFAERPTTLLQIPQAALLRLLDQHPEYWRELGLLMSHKLRMLFGVLEAHSLLPAAPRLARRLLLIAEGYGGASIGRRELNLPQEQLASMLSLSRQTTNQILKELEARGILRLGYGTIEIVDHAGLCDAAQNPG
ncbi:Crp/Fnr family transcriptional regulator [Pseudomonas schmalbachii]|uniref:Crp/Fnr family transcriptional regulator n=1 Tax=Pseudomonas schmalbachii TaxID=2816993 RepID=A0ABS3TR81_9PSED|nr:Crp/Fnr family transcriptional regulator [Pseudomonas schmalbachii]MBO3276176.1 Crp/Fnr family transcriptional regulator [Pseudomonas schmalbachii]